MKAPILPVLAAVLCLAGLSRGQIAFEESMTNWTHAGSTGWTDDFVLASAKGGKVDRLNSDTTLQYTRTITSLKKGHYVATIRLMKFQDATGVAPLTFEVIAGTKVSEDTIEFSQATDRWVFVQTVAFSILADNAPAIFRLQNLDTTVTKQNYYFDWFKIGQIPEGKVLKYQSLDYDYAPWRGTWQGNSSWFKDHVAETTSAFGEVSEPAGVNWMEHRSFYGWNATDPAHDMILQPGTYTFNFRIFVPTSSLYAYELKHKVGAASWVTYTWATAEQVPGQWNHTPNISFQVTQPNTGLRFIFQNIQSIWKYSYKLDSFMLRRGAFDLSGTACKSSVGSAELTGNVPQLGEPFTVQVAGCPTVGVFMLGAQQVSIDLTAAGATGCTLYTLPVVTLPAVAQGNVATLGFPIPNVAALIGATWYEQALVVDPQANKLGLAFSQLGTALIEN